jgi:hypothetical protein
MLQRTSEVTAETRDTDTIIACTYEFVHWCVEPATAWDRRQPVTRQQEPRLRAHSLT